MSKTKEVTSLLFSSEMSRDTYDRFAGKWNEFSRSKNYSHEVPPIELNLRKHGEVKCIFNFTPQIDGAAPIENCLSDFLESHSEFIIDVLSIAGASHAFELSALVNVDAELAAFELVSPRIPASLAALPNFRFGYWVWHSPAS